MPGILYKACKLGDIYLAILLMLPCWQRHKKKTSILSRLWKDGHWWDTACFWMHFSSLVLERGELAGGGAEPTAERVGVQTGRCGHPGCESQAQTWGVEEPKCHKSLLCLWTGQVLQRGVLKSLGTLDFSGTQYTKILWIFYLFFFYGSLHYLPKPSTNLSLSKMGFHSSHVNKATCNMLPCSPALLLMFSYPIPRPHCTEIHLSWGFAEAVSVCEEPGLFTTCGPKSEPLVVLLLADVCNTR